MYSISIIYSHFHRFYNFKSGEIDYEANKDYRTSDHYTDSKEEAKRVYEKLVEIEQRKDYGHAKTVYSYCQDKIFNF